MENGGARIAVLLVGVVAVFCCAGPLIMAAIGVTALVAWLSESAYVLIAGGVIALMCAILWLRYRRVHTSDGRGIRHLSEVTK